MAGGRPTEYDSEVLALAKAYLQSFFDKEPPELEVYPSIVGLSRYVNRAKSTLYKWSEEEDKAEFSDVFTQVLEVQELVLTNGGLSNQFNPAITKMLLTKHGYSDKVQQDNVSSDGSMTPKETKVIQNNMSPDEATQIYQDMLNGK